MKRYLADPQVDNLPCVWLKRGLYLTPDNSFGEGINEGFPHRGQER